MRFAIVLVLLAWGAANACPPGPCNKYRRRVPAGEATVQTYRRAGRALPPYRFDRRALARLLTTSTWLPIAVRATPQPTLPPRSIRFVDPARVDRRMTAERVVLVRQLERRARAMYVEVDGVFFEVTRCRDGRATTTCLERVDALPDELDEPDHRFATPP